MSQSKKKGRLKKLFKDAPDWLVSDYRIELSIKGEKKIGRFDENLESIQDLQGFWMLKNMAASLSNEFPCTSLVEHFWRLYGEERWAIKVAGMEALINRIKSAKKENLILAERRPNDQNVFGYYRVKQKGQKTKSYRILLSNQDKLDASCSCKDFQKNTLKFCKHIAAVILHWYSSDYKRKKYLNSKRDLHKVRITHFPKLQLKEIEHPLCETRIFIPKIKQKNMGVTLEKLINYFSLVERDKAGDYYELKPLKGKLERQLANWCEIKKLLNRLSKNVWVDPVVFPLIDKEIENLQWPSQYKRNNQKLKKVLRNLKIKLYPYQTEGVERALEKGKFLLGDDMGLGKTIQAISWAESLLQTRHVKKVLVICPAALKGQWKREWHQVYERKVAIVEGTPEQREEFYQNNSAVKILNYELLLRDLDSILAIEPDAIILDEAQRIKNYASQTAQAVKCLKSSFRLILTGTPMENRIQDLSSLMDWIDDHAMGPGWRIKSQFRMDGDGHSRSEGKKGVQSLGLLRKILSKHLLRRTRSQVLKDLPSRSDSHRVVTLTTEQRDIHDDYAQRVARLMSIGQQRPLSPQEHLRLMSYLGQMRIVSNGLSQFKYEELWPSLKNDNLPSKRIPHLSSPKLETFRDLIEGYFLQGQVKIVVFSQWQRMLRLANWAISDLLEQENAEAVFFTGKENTRRRNENIVRFHDDPNVKIFFATDAGGVGLNLQKAATVCINLELPWNPAVLEQRIARVHRLGQKFPVQVVNITSENSIEERITTLVGQKKEVFNALFDGHTDHVLFDDNSSFYSQVREIVQERKVGPNEKHLLDISDEDYEDHEEEIELSDDMGSEIEHQNLENSLIEQEVTPISLSKSVTAQNIGRAFSQIKIERTNDGLLKIEASGESAKLLASVFKGMAQMFEEA